MLHTQDSAHPKTEAAQPAGDYARDGLLRVMQQACCRATQQGLSASWKTQHARCQQECRIGRHLSYAPAGMQQACSMGTQPGQSG